jgi:threonine aldolase
VVALENTHNTAGGTVWPLDELSAVVEVARELQINAHLDGARLLNASVALQVAPAEISWQFDTATLCLSKGLGCPLGALITGSSELMARARREKHRFGGAMRQAGIAAAAGVYALDHNVERLADDHARARRMGEAWAAAGLPVDLALVETNFVQVDVGALGLGEWEAVGLLRDAGVLLSRTMKPGVLRAVTHLDVDDDDVAEAVRLVPEALEAGVRAA